MIDAIGRPQSVLVLGGASEIGQAIVARLVPDRCRTVVLAGREGPRLAEAVDRAKAKGAEVAESVAFDATDVAGHAAFVDRVFERFGDLDLVVVAAGMLGDQDRDELDPEAAASVIDTNFTGLAAVMLAVAGPLTPPGARPAHRALLGRRTSGPPGQFHLRVLQGRTGRASARGSTTRWRAAAPGS